MRKTYSCLLAAFCFWMQIWSIPASAQTDAITGLVLNEVLNNFTKRIQSIVAQTGGEARDTARVAAGEANVLVNNIAFQYKDSLDYTVKTTDVDLTNQLQKVSSVIAKLESKTSQDVNAALDQIQQITFTIPFSKKDPQLTRQSPSLVSSAVERLLLRLDGVFYNAADSGFEPYVTVNGRTVFSSDNKTNKLIFSIDSSALLTAPDRLIINNLKVTIPYKPSCWYCFFQKANATFNLMLGVLPNNAGMIEISAIHSVGHVEQRIFTSGSLGMSSQDCCNRQGEVCDSPIPPGWSYVPNSAQMIELNEIGGSAKYHDWDEKGPRVGTSVCWYVETYQHNHGTDGNISFRIRYTLQHTVDSDVNENLSTMRAVWGESKVVQLPENLKSWKLTYTMFDKSRVIETSNVGRLDPPYVEITRPSTNALQINVAPPPDL